jgi:subtilase family serine protease
MTSFSLKPLLKPLSNVACFIPVSFVVALCAALPAISQTAAQTAALQPRITAPIDSSRRATLAGSRPPRANSANDIGAVSPSMKLQGISLVFSRSAAQQTALDNLVAAQQNPASPLYHHWLTPEQFAAQFGVADADIAAVESWLEQQGFSVDSVSHSRNRITFSGTAAQVASAFGAPLHYYRSPSETTSHFAPSTDLTLPSALASTVLSIENLSSFRPHAHVKVHAPQAQPHFTSSQTGENFLTPADVDTIYDVSAATGAGYTGTGQTIVIIGQSAVENADLTDFQTAAGIPAKLPTFILMPGTGTSTINPGGSKDSDEIESDLDLEYSDAIAQGATIDFIYTGSNTNFGAFDALQYAIDNKSMYPADIISSSYGECEAELGQSNYNSLNASLEQASTQGQTVIAAAGDDGSTDCNGETTNASEEEALAVDFPASSQYVTGMGGTEFLLADIAPGSPYFDAETSTDIIGSAKSYIPEQVWNDDAGDVSLGETSPSPISSGGGGVSIFTPRPSWQIDVPGIPSSGNRLVPDISLYASPSEPDVAAKTFYGGFLFCSSDTTFTGVTGSCTHGFRDVNNADLTVAGGTSFDAPIFSGMLAIINQARGFTSTNGQGVINPTLYTLAANPTTYASAFHDITVGGNQCLAGATFCGTGDQTTDYLSTTGYDEASGLGSIDLFNLLTAWPTGTATVGSNSFTLSATSVTVAPGSSTTGTITITPANSYTGTINLSVNSALLTDGCVILNPTSATVTGTAAVTASYTVYTSTSACTTAGAVRIGPSKSAALNPGTAPHQPKSPWKQLPLPATLAGTFLLLCFRRRSRLLRASITLGLLLLSISGLGLIGCGGSSSTSTTSSSTNPTNPTNTPAGTYTVTLIGTDSVNASITSSTTFTVTVN